MPDQCPYLEYRPLSTGDETGETDASDAESDDSRPFCTAADRFVQAMRADVCNDRYDLDHETDCEIYRDAEELPEFPEAGDAETEVSGGDGAGGEASE